MTSGVGVYIHFPWCARKCPYCDFATRAITQTDIPHERYADALLREIELRSGSWLSQPLHSIFFGGGTPSLWQPAQLGRVLASLRSTFPGPSNIEITVECNPSSFSAALADGLREAGVNRVSLGIQSLRDEHLRFLGRLHDRQRALDAFRIAREAGFRVSGDFMFGMPGQSPGSLEEDLAEFLAETPEHLSVYSLTIEEGTQFATLARKGQLRVADEDTYADLYLTTERVLQRAGFEHYEVSNYAQPGAHSSHNLHYWRGGDYLGLGAAAVGAQAVPDFGRYRYTNAKDPARYLDAISQGRLLLEEEEVLNAADVVRERLMMGLRTAEGLDTGEVVQMTGRDVALGRESDLRRALEHGDVVLHGRHLRIPPDRWLRMDGILTALF